VNVGRHLMIGLRGTELDAEARQLLRVVRPGGVVLFARNIESTRQVRALCRALPAGTIIAIDQENRRVNRLRNIVGELPGIADIKSPERFGRDVGRSLRRLGVHLDFAPVLDLEVFDAKTDNALRERCWGKTAAEVTARAGAFLRGLQAAGVAGCGKHFPGLGGARCDSHEALPVIRRATEAEREPYAALMPDLVAVMVSHGLYPSLDNKPASLSRKIIGGLLRRRLKFNGLVFTDDLEMKALPQTSATVVRAFRAGADMLLLCHTPEKILAAHEALSRAKLPAARFAESARRIQQFRRRWL
jgi:beta-N-acetylhexosaminidase